MISTSPREQAQGQTRAQGRRWPRRRTRQRGPMTSGTEPAETDRRVAESARGAMRLRHTSGVAGEQGYRGPNFLRAHGPNAPDG